MYLARPPLPPPLSQVLFSSPCSSLAPPLVRPLLSTALVFLSFLAPATCRPLLWTPPIFTHAARQRFPRAGAFPTALLPPSKRDVERTNTNDPSTPPNQPLRARAVVSTPGPEPQCNAYQRRLSCQVVTLAALGGPRLTMAREGRAAVRRGERRLSAGGDRSGASESGIAAQRVAAVTEGVNKAEGRGRKEARVRGEGLGAATARPVRCGRCRRAPRAPLARSLHFLLLLWRSPDVQHVVAPAREGHRLVRGTVWATGSGRWTALRAAAVQLLLLHAARCVLVQIRAHRAGIPAQHRLLPSQPACRLQSEQQCYLEQQGHPCLAAARPLCASPRHPSPPPLTGSAPLPGCP